MNAAKNRSLDGSIITIPQAMEKSNMGKAMVRRLAEESGSLIRIGRMTRVNWPVFYAYVVENYTA
ncbi:MAG: DUF6462 family protein [Clostridiales bacterium]|nr:DUF6462 family protein [Clostridiales bacterium]